MLTVYVPANWKAAAIIAPRSAIVGQEVSRGVPSRPRWVDVYYEGWINGPMQYADRDARGLWEAGVYHAADRMVHEYPTIARAHLPADTLQPIGSYDPATGVVTVTDEAALNRWLGVGET